MFYVYEWFVKKTEEIIYVGKGTGKRYKAKKKNKMLNYFISQFDCDVRIVKHFEDEQEAFDYEREYIDLMKSKGQCVCNIYRGGYGGPKSVWSEEKRKRMSESNPMKSEKQKKRMSKQNPMKNPEYVQLQAQKVKRAVIINGVKYDGVIDAAKGIGVAPNTVQAWLRWGCDASGNPCRHADEDQRPMKKRRTTCSRPVLVDGVRFESLKAAADSIGASSNSVIAAIKENRPCKGHVCEYDNQQPSRTNSNKSSAEGSETR